MITIPFAYAYSIFFLCAIFQHNVQEFDFGLQVVYFTMVDVKAKILTFILIYVYGYGKTYI
jgi:hypothetical protein